MESQGSQPEVCMEITCFTHDNTNTITKLMIRLQSLCTFQSKKQTLKMQKSFFFFNLPAPLAFTVKKSITREVKSKAT